MEIEITHIILKIDDIEKYCNSLEKAALSQIIDSIQKGRQQDGKPIDNTYVVVNLDEPYAKEVVEIINKHEKDLQLSDPS